VNIRRIVYCSDDNGVTKLLQLMLNGNMSVNDVFLSLMSDLAIAI